MVKEFGAWPELVWASGDRFDGTPVCGVDVGSTSVQAVILADGALVAYASLRCGYDFGEAAETALTRTLAAAGLSRGDIKTCRATGFGRRRVAFADATSEEIACHGLGARYVFGPEVRTVADLGGQRTKAIRLYDWDRVRDFKISDKCAAGMGRGIERIANLLEIPISEIGERSLSAEKDPEPVSTTCCNFMYPETIGLLRQGFREDEYSENDVLAAAMFTVAWRALGTIGKLAPLDIGEISLDGALGFTGGLAKNPGVTKRIERELGVNALPAKYDPLLAGAIGAALLAERDANPC
jgi:predicted CoA-substrate-specific enzyme activase